MELTWDVFMSILVLGFGIGFAACGVLVAFVGVEITTNHVRVRQWRHIPPRERKED